MKETKNAVAGAAGPSEREAQFTEEFLKQVVELSEVLDKLRPGTGGAVAMFCQDAYEKGWQARAAVPQSSPSEREATSSGSRSDSSISTSNRIQASSEAGDGLSLPDLLSNVISHVEWVQSHGRMRAAQTSEDKEMNAFNHGRVDAAESILFFYEQEKRQARAAVPAPGREREALQELLEWLENDTLEIMKDTMKMGITFDQRDCQALREQIEKAQKVLADSGATPKEGQMNKYDAFAEQNEDFESLPGHYPEDDGFCFCGAFCETGTRFRQHLQDVANAGRVSREGEPHGD
jgi:hypothetical protein